MGGLLRLLLWLALLAGAFVGVARAVAVRWLWLPMDDPVLTASLQPSLGAGDLILVQRIMKPVLGDLVVCPEPNYPERYVIGRILGVEGDKLSITNGTVRVNGQGLPYERRCDPRTVSYPNPEDGSETITQTCSYEAVANRSLHKVGGLSEQHARKEERTFSVPEGHFFLISDNRLFPYDSRDYHPVPIESCKETVFLRLVGANGWSDTKQRMTVIQ